MPTERLSKQERDNLDEFARIIRQVQRELAVTIKEALLSGQLERAATRRLHLARVVAVLDQMGAEIDPRARRIVNDAFQRGSEVMARQILELKLPELPQVAVLGTGVSQEAVQMLQDSIVGRLKGAREAVGRQTDDLFAHAGRRAAVRAVLGSDGSPEKAGRRLAADLLKNKDIARQVELTGRFKLTPGGRNWALPDYTDMVVRTTTRQAVAQGSLLRMASNGINIARWSIHANPCPVCAPYQGTLVSLDGSTGEYEGEPYVDIGSTPGIPAHPRCRCSWAAVAVRVEQIKRDLAGSRTTP